MANYSNLKTAIENAVDWNNGDNEITGQNLLDILETIIDSLGAKYKFADVATPSSSITTPDEPLFYLAGEGTYTNFSGLSVTIPRGTLAIFYYDTAWHYTTVRTDSDAFFNVNQYLGTPSTTYTKANGRNAVPSALRSKGMIITYLTTNGWLIEQNLSTSGTWNADANWQTIGPVSVSQNTNTGGQQLYIGGTKTGNIDDFFNVNSYNDKGDAYTDADTARGAVPSGLRALGMNIKYLLADGWHTDQFIGTSLSNWGNTENWLPVMYDGQNILFNGDVDYSAPGYNRLIVDNVLLPTPSTDVILEYVNNSGAELNIRLIHPDNTYTQIVVGGSGLVEYNETAVISKVFAYFNTGLQPDGYVKINVITKPSIYWDIVHNYITEQTDKTNIESDLIQKADIDVGINLVNPEFVESNKFFNTNGDIMTASSSSYKITGFIRVNGQDIISNGASASYLSTYVVYDKDYNKLRTIVNSGKQYTYQDGDFYVRIGFETNGECYANYGTTLSQTPYTKYHHYDMLRDEMNAKIATIPIDNIINGEKTVCVNATEMDKNPTYYEPIDIDSFIYKSLVTTANVWCSSKVFQPDLSLPVRIKAKAKLLQGTERTFDLWVSPSVSYDSQRTTDYHSFSFPAGVNEIDIDFSFDPQYFIVYKNFTTDFSIWFQSKGDGTTATHIQFDDFAIYQMEGEQTFNNFSGESLPELLHSLDENFPTDVEVAEDENIKVAPNGKKFALQVANNGDLITIPVIPTKAHFFGNSLLSGNVFGMAASDQYHDYYYLINNFISSQITGYSSDKHSISDFERAETIESARALIQTLVGYLTGDEDLIFVQIGDNVSQQALENVFSTSFKELILAIRNVCQTARIIIFGCWYSSTARIELLSKVARETGCLFINITDLNTIANQSFIGAIQQRTYSSNWTLENVTNVVDNGELHTGYAHNITVTFTVSGTTYTATVDCTTYSLDGTTLQYYSDYYIIPNSGVGSHPGDAGFKAITNRVLYKSGMVDTENYLN